VAERPLDRHHVAPGTDKPGGVEVPQVVQPVLDLDLVADLAPPPSYRRRVRRQLVVASAGEQPPVRVIARPVQPEDVYKRQVLRHSPPSSSVF